MSESKKYTPQEVVSPYELQGRLDTVLDGLYGYIDTGTIVTTPSPISLLGNLAELLEFSELPETYKDVVRDQATHAPAVSDLFDNDFRKARIPQLPNILRDHRGDNAIFGKNAVSVAIDMLNAYKDCGNRDEGVVMRMRFEAEVRFGVTVNKKPDGTYAVVD